MKREYRDRDREREEERMIAPIPEYKCGKEKRREKRAKARK